MTKSIRSLTKRVGSSRTGLAALVLHLLLFVYCVGQKTQISDDAVAAPNQGGGFYTLFAGRPFHFEHESTLFQIILILDAPALAVDYVVSTFVGVFASPSAYTQSWLDAWVVIFASSIQWLLVGCFMEWILSTKSADSRRVSPGSEPHRRTPARPARTEPPSEAGRE